MFLYPFIVVHATLICAKNLTVHSLLIQVAVKDSFVLWPNGHCQFIYYRSDCGNVKKHGSGWAMRNTNNHNKYILKKSCLGVLVCSSEDCHVMLRPAICDKARKAQQGELSALISTDVFNSVAAHLPRMR